MKEDSDWIERSELEILIEAWEKKAEAFEMDSPIRDLSFAHALRDCSEDLEKVLEDE